MLCHLVDSEIERAVALAGQGQIPAAIDILTPIATTNDDYQIRSFSHYQMAQIYFSVGDWWRWRGEAAQIFVEESGTSIQTFWRYRLAADQSDYLLDRNTKPDYDLRNADFTVEKDVTQSPEPRFCRSLVNARYGNVRKAKTDSDFLLSVEPDSQPYRALAAYIAALNGDNGQLQPFSGETITDPRALSLLG